MSQFLSNRPTWRLMGTCTFLFFLMSLVYDATTATAACVSDHLINNVLNKIEFYELNNGQLNNPTQ